MRRWPYWGLGVGTGLETSSADGARFRPQMADEDTEMAAQATFTAKPFSDPQPFVPAHSTKPLTGGRHSWVDAR